jgi:Holliday junction resolvase RusA-like endonuclease
MATLELLVPRELKSPNRWQGRHWRYKYRETQEWEKCIGYTAMAAMRVKGLQGALLVLGAFPWQTCQTRRRVTVTRYAPSRRRFIRDDDNLRFAVKPVLDALKRLKLIRDDHRKWLDLPVPIQEVDEQLGFATKIVIEEV